VTGEKLKFIILTPYRSREAEFIILTVDVASLK
jgi:hypothetical protein